MFKNANCRVLAEPSQNKNSRSTKRSDHRSAKDLTKLRKSNPDMADQLRKRNGDFLIGMANWPHGMYIKAHARQHGCIILGRLKAIASSNRQ